MAENKKTVTPSGESPMDKLKNAMIGYTLDLIEETKKVNSNEKHKITEEITNLYSVIKG